MTDKAKRVFRHSHLTDFSHAIMDWIGSVSSLVVHTALFAISFSLMLFGVNADHVLLVLTTVVSLEAIYMAIFIQMAINLNSKSLDGVEEDLDEIQEDVDEIQKDLDELQEDVEKIEKVDQGAESAESENRMVLSKIESQLQTLLMEINRIKGANHCVHAVNGQLRLLKPVRSRAVKTWNTASYLKSTGSSSAR